MPVGRLDKDSTGLLLLTNDGELAHRLTHPSFEHEKEYEALVEVAHSWSAAQLAAALKKIEQGIRIAHGFTTSPAAVRLLKRAPGRRLSVSITIHEGRKRQVRQMLDAVGMSVVALKRTRSGPIRLGDLPEGEYRELTQEEIAQLENELNSAGYDWLVNYSLRDDPHGPNLTYPRVEVYEKDKNDTIATFEKISEDKEYKIYLTNLNGSQNTFDLKVFSPRDDSGEPGGSVWFDYIVDPIILGNANSVNTNTTYENNFTHLNVSNSSIVAYYPFDVQETSENVTFDYSDNSNDGTLVNTTFKNTGCIYGNCYTFDVVNSSVNIDTAVNDLATTTKGTWSAWVKPVDATPAAQYSIITFGDVNGNAYLRYFIQSTTGILRAASVNAGLVKWTLDTNANPFSDNTWTHVAIVQDGTSPVLYINGVAVAQTFTSSADKTFWFVRYS